MGKGQEGIEISRGTDNHGPAEGMKHPYRLLVENQGEGIGLVTTEEVFLFANPAAERIFGVGPGELVGRSINEFLDEENLKIVREMTARRIMGERDSYLLDIDAADGVRRTIHVTAVPQTDENGHVTGAYGIFRDVTAEVTAQRKLQRSEKTLRAIIESTADGILVISATGRVLHANSAFSRMWGIPEALIEKGDDRELLDFVLDQLKEPGEFLERVERLYQSDEEAFDTIEFRDGRIFERYSRPLWLEGEGRCRIWSFRDVTKRVRAERAVRNQTARLSAIIEGMQEGVLLLDRSGLVLEANGYFCKMVGCERGELVGSEIFPLLGQEFSEELRGILAELAEGTLRDTRVLQLQMFDRELVLRVQPLEKQDEAAELLLTFNDVTDIVAARKAAEEALRIKSDFVATMSHEVRTPLNGMLGMLQLLAETDLDEEKREYVQAALDSAATLKRVLDDVLDFSRLEAGRMKIMPRPVDIREKVAQALKSLELQAEEKGLAFQVDISREVPETIVVDGDRLCQVMTNLVNNALRFTDEGGIEVKVQIAERGKQPHLAVSVIDTGIGIPSQDRKKIFESFTQLAPLSTRKQGGTGLGLAICQKIVELMGGTISVDENPRGGSIFRFEVPVGFERHLLDGKGPSPDGQVASAMPVWNIEELLHRMGGDEEMVREMVAIFAEQAPAAMAALREAVHGGDDVKMATFANTLKSAAISVDAVRLAEVARQFEKKVGTVTAEQLKSYLARLEEEIRTFLDYTGRILSKDGQ
ncbi:MAG: PAS domain S-box protein [Deltaproteobacteria bacterium]|nr:MAG: PAS domain S-box protein [Deltaproteobacteria bacterium]